MTVINGNYRKYELDNGLVVALQNTQTQTVFGELRVNYGSSHEKEGEEGLAHFLEHCLVTGGSEKFDPLTADKIRTSFGFFNSYTNIGRTLSIGQMLSEDLETWLDYISNHLFKPRFDQKRVDEERGRVLREISDDKSNSIHLEHVKLRELFYRGHPKGISVLGKEEVIKNTNLKKLAAFHRKGYHPNNMDLILVGDLPNNIGETVENYFGSLLAGENTRKEFPELKPLEDKIILHVHTPEKINRENPEESSAGMLIRYIGPVDGHEDEYAVKVMNNILGSGSNSLLFQNVSLKKGLAYDIDIYGNGSYNAGELNVSAYVPARKIDEALGSIFEEFERMKTERVDKKTLERIKRGAKYNLAKTFETNGGHISAIEQKLDGRISPEHFLKELDKITPKRVLEVSNKYLPDKEDGKYVLYIRDPLKD